MKSLIEGLFIFVFFHFDTKQQFLWIMSHVHDWKVNKDIKRAMQVKIFDLTIQHDTMYVEFIWPMYNYYNDMQN